MLDIRRKSKSKTKQNNTVKLTLNLENPNTLVRLVQDLAVARESNESKIIENSILNNYLPIYTRIRSIVENVLYQDGKGFGPALACIFGLNHGDEHSNAQITNMLPLVEFAYEEESMAESDITGNEDEIHNILRDLRALVSRLQHFAEKEKSPDHKLHLFEAVKWGDFLIEELDTEPEFTHLCNIYRLIIDNWKELGGWSVTYNLLSYLAELEKGWHDTASSRLQLLKLVKELSPAW